MSRLIAAGALTAFLLSATTMSAQTLGLHKPTVRIGVEDGSEIEVLGHIAGVAVDRAGNVFVLDDLSHSIKWFGKDGRPLGLIGRQGSGPGELRSPVSIITDGVGSISVLDPGNARISSYGVVNGKLRHVEDTRALGFDMCVIGSRRYLLFPSDTGLIHEIDARGNTIRSFGSNEQPAAVPPQHARILREVNNRGKLLCDEQRRAIVLLHERLPVVRAFATDGRELWRTTLKNYHPVHWEFPNGTVVRMAPDPKSNTAHTGVSIVKWQGYYVVTLHEGSIKNREGQLEARILDAASGKELTRERVPVRIAAALDRLIIGFAEAPYPFVAIY